MIFRFDLFRLELLQRENLREILDIIQSENVGEIVVFAVELPYKLLVVTDDNIELLEGFEKVGAITGSCNRERSPAAESRANAGSGIQGERRPVQLQDQGERRQRLRLKDINGDIKVQLEIAGRSRTRDIAGSSRTS